MAVPSVFKYGFDAPCDSYACHSRAEWAVGEPNNYFVVAKLCSTCMGAVVQGLFDSGFISPAKEEEAPAKEAAPAAPANRRSGRKR